MIGDLKVWLAHRKLRRAQAKLASLVAKRKAELERREYAKHRAAGKLGWQHRRTA